MERPPNFGFYSAASNVTLKSDTENPTESPSDAV